MILPPTPPRMSGGDWLSLSLLSVLWGGSFLFAKIALGAFGPLTVAGARVVLAASILLALLAWRRGGFALLIAHFPALFVMGVLNNAIPFTLIFWGQRDLGAGLAAIFNATTPLSTVLLAHFLTTEEKLTGAKLAGIGLGIAGVAVLVGPSAWGVGDIPLPAAGAVLAATLSYACASLWGRRFRGLPSLVAAAGQLTGSSLILAPAALLFETPIWPASPTPIAAVVALAVLSTALGYLIFFRLLARAGATNTSLVTLLVPPSALILGALILGEAITLHALAGLGLIAAGLTAIDGRIWARLRQL